MSRAGSFQTRPENGIVFSALVLMTEPNISRFISGCFRAFTSMREKYAIITYLKRNGC